MNLKSINTDIVLAKAAISPAINPTNDEYFYDAAAFHVQQAIEKSLKYILHDIYGDDDTAHGFKTHNITALIRRLYNYDSSFPGKHKDLSDMSGEISEWATPTRYGESIVATLDKVKKALTIAESLYDEAKGYKPKNHMGGRS